MLPRDFKNFAATCVFVCSCLKCENVQRSSSVYVAQPVFACVVASVCYCLLYMVHATVFNVLMPWFKNCNMEALCVFAMVFMQQALWCSTFYIVG